MARFKSVADTRTICPQKIKQISPRRNRGLTGYNPTEGWGERGLFKQIIRRGDGGCLLLA